LHVSGFTVSSSELNSHFGQIGPRVTLDFGDGHPLVKVFYRLSITFTLIDTVCGLNIICLDGLQVIFSVVSCLSVCLIVVAIPKASPPILANELQSLTTIL